MAAIFRKCPECGGRLSLAFNILCVADVDPETGEYRHDEESSGAETPHEVWCADCRASWSEFTEADEGGFSRLGVHKAEGHPQAVEFDPRPARKARKIEAAGQGVMVL